VRLTFTGEGEPSMKNGQSCACTRLPPYARSEVGGRRCRQPGQVRKEAATTISCRVVGFHLLFAFEFELALPA